MNLMHFRYLFSMALAVIGCVLARITNIWLLQLFESAEKESLDLVIGILSSRSNFEQRETIRQTWKNHSVFHQPSQIKAVFVVGGKSCPIPLEDRINMNSCEEWNINNDDAQDAIEEKLKMTCEVKQSSFTPPNSAQLIYEGFTILIHHPIVVKRLAVLSSIIENNKNITIVLIDAITEDEITLVKISPSKHSVILNGYHYFSIEPILLPKKFEAAIFVRGMPLNFHSDMIIKWNSPRKYFSYTQLHKKTQNNIVVKHHPSAISAVSFGFVVHDIKQLQFHLENKKQRLKTWTEVLEKEKIDLDEEVSKHRDIVIVDEIDVYSNLPQKMLHFYHWVITHFYPDYIMKTDDDTLINMDVLLKEFKTIRALQRKKLWWSKFRYNWLVDRVGKWRELDYGAAVYPPFACGSGNIISKDLVIWLGENYKNLHAYQGEDVSLGIWLAALGPTYLNDPQWHCENTCDKNSYNIGQLSPFQMRTIWKNIQLCKNICTCSQ